MLARFATTSSAMLAALLMACGGKTSPAADATADVAAETLGDTGADVGVEDGDAGPFACGDAMCPADQLCQRLLMQGGPLVLPDAGNCPAGRVDVNGQCQQLPSYHCMPTPPTCGATIDCACAGDYCLMISSCPYQCRGTNGRELDCECDVP